ncbi:alpha-catulin isoform X3 [Patella vulgata]|uniref:alpha-catulin isoform X3 n=1 Tax=Patella vulgata TaxID=6465 RepID=UPI0021807ABF|nr:alpha-catulin isoform X3 [Patella vulgata]
MAGSLSKSDSSVSLEIRTKSVEQTLIPLVSQITTLVNHKDKTKVSEKAQRALVRVGQLVNLAVERFVTVGESIACEHVEIQEEMMDACREAKTAGCNIESATKLEYPIQNGIDALAKHLADKSAMIRSARQLLSAITKVLLLADRIVVKQLLLAKDKVFHSLLIVEAVTNFTDFVKSFSQFGTDMVELAHLSGDRQNDLKSEKHRAQMGSARAILEKSTMMLLTSSKTCLRHPDCQAARRNRDGVFVQMKRALDLLQHVVTDGSGLYMNGNSSPTTNGDSGIALNTSQPTASRAFKDFEDQVELTRITLIGPATEDKLQGAFDAVVEGVQDFTDSAYTSHDNREKIVQLSDSLRDQLHVLIKTGHNVSPKENHTITPELETVLLKTIEASKNLRKQLLDTAMEQASDLFKMNEDHELLRGLQRAGINGEVEYVDELTIKFDEHQEQIEEVCKLFRHMATTEPLIITAEHNDTFIHSIGPLTLFAAQTLAQYPNSKIARENLDVFADAWESQINDLSILVKEVNDVCLGKMDKLVYLSLPRPGKHGTTSRSLRPARLDAEEQAKIAKLGLEMKLITSEMDAETDKWEEPDNDIVKRARNMSSMAFSMYLFTRGEGALRTTQDLFVQAEFFAEEGNKLYKTVRDFAQRVPSCPIKEEMLAYVDRIPVSCQQILFTLKSSTFGKTPTFNKVDSTIQETKNLMNVIAKIVTTCFICATKFNIDYRSSPSSLSLRYRSPAQFDMRSSGSDTTDSGLSPHSDLYRSASLNRNIHCS